MKIIYILYFSSMDSQELGVLKKVRGQIAAFEELGHEVTLCSLEEDKIYLKTSSNLLIVNDKKRFNKRQSIYTVIKDVLKTHKWDAAYIRFPGFIDSSFFKTLKILKKNHIKVLLELPTYPIKGELKNNLRHYFVGHQFIRFFSRAIAYVFHWAYSKKIKKHVDKIVTYMPYSKIWGIEVIDIDNGVNVDKCHVVQKISHEELRLIVVANIARWHGIDRVIDGLKNYYQQESSPSLKVCLSVIGQTETADELKQYASANGVLEYCDFLGRKDGDDLYNEYCRSDIAIGSLGMHRIGVLNGSTLKVKEYCAHGIPFVYAYHEKALDDSFQYALQCEATDEALDIINVVEFYKRLNMTSEKSKEMHAFALENFTWKKQIKQLLFRMD